MREYDNTLQLQEQIAQEIDFSKLTEFCDHLTDAIHEIFRSCGLYFRIFSRVKSVDSIAGKLVRRQYGTEQNPKKLQDLIGIRVVLYYYDDLSICREIMESTFQMLDHWSRTSPNANEFKATKINGVFRFPAEYFNSYKKALWTLPIDTTFEVQFRTVFFEGWHEIEHDMRYKSLLSDNQFWDGNEELSRILNCVLANLELSDWSLVQLFDQLSYNHYKSANWELMLKSKFRIHMDDTSELHPDILAVFDRDKNIAKQFFKCSRKELIRELMKQDAPQPSYNLIVRLLNEYKIHNEEIAEIYKNLPNIRDEKTHPKTVFARLDSSVLFHLETPLLHKDTRTLEAEFTNASYVIYKWVRFKLNPVFTDIPEDLCSYQNKLPGYRVKIDYQPDNMVFTMKLNHIDITQAGTLWHIHSSIALLEDGRLHFYHMTSRDMPHGASHQITFSKPSFMNDLCSKIGLADVIRLGNKAHFVTTPGEFEQFCSLIDAQERQLPAIAIIQQDTSEENISNHYTEGYDMNTFTINGTRLAKVVGQYAHVHMIDRNLVTAFSERFNYPVSTVPGAIVIFWPTSQDKTPDAYTQEAVCNAEFDFNRFAFHDDNISEKAFRHKLVQIIKDDNISR
ncbi:MAG: hypothetical protein J1E62_08700 [Lachnospiraceae bacterium]|nr:hypothetical protein [Lachnospiraceae bacterium]